MAQPTSTRAFLDFAVDAAWQAGQLTLAHFQTGVAVEQKADASPVTVADRGAEQLLRRLIEGRFPGHAIVGEEFGETNRDSTHRWIIDPIDGTQSFIRGVPLYGVLIGLEIVGEVVVGVAYLPGLGEMVAAARGEGCRWNGRPAHVSDVTRLDQALVTYTDYANFARYGRADAWARLQAATHTQRGWSDCYGHCLVATGRADVMIEPIMNPWDCAALLPILQEAGGTFTDWDGKATIYGSNAISTNGALFEQVMEIVQSGWNRPFGAVGVRDIQQRPINRPN
jgi:histidinol phosphatase-like enzyme (inositol monophosphatase family)